MTRSVTHPVTGYKSDMPHNASHQRRSFAASVCMRLL
jgi:hypothetical protein